MDNLEGHLFLKSSITAYDDKGGIAAKEGLWVKRAFVLEPKCHKLTFYREIGVRYGHC